MKNAIFFQIPYFDSLEKFTLISNQACFIENSWK
jgi:hypothetical protein